MSFLLLFLHQYRSPTALFAVVSFICPLAFREEICLCFDTAIRVTVWKWTRLLEELPTMNTATVLNILLPNSILQGTSAIVHVCHSISKKLFLKYYLSLFHKEKNPVASLSNLTWVSQQKTTWGFFSVECSLSIWEKVTELISSVQSEWAMLASLPSSEAWIRTGTMKESSMLRGSLASLF